MTAAVQHQVSSVPADVRDPADAAMVRFFRLPQFSPTAAVGRPPLSADKPTGGCEAHGTAADPQTVPHVTSTATLRLRGSGEHLRLRVTKAPDPLVNVRECCRGSVAVEKAIGEAIREALAAGRSWAEVGQALGVKAHTSVGVAEQYDSSRRWTRKWFWDTDGQGQ